jgi:hypothetical protein
METLLNVFSLHYTYTIVNLSYKGNLQLAYNNNNNKLYLKKLKKVQYSIETSLAELILQWAFCLIDYLLQFITS